MAISQGAKLEDAFATAVAHHRAGRLSEAEEIYRSVLEAAPDNPHVLNLLGAALNQSGRHEEAVEALSRAAALLPSEPTVHNNLGNALRNLGRAEDAAAAYGRALEIKPDYAMALSNLGNAHYEAGRLDEAVAAYRRAVELDPGSVRALSNLGNALLDQGRLEEAESVLEQAVSLDPGFAKALSNLGNVLIARGRAKEALAHLERAVALDADLADAHNNLGIALMELGRLDEAAHALERALELAPDLAPALVNLSTVLKEKSRLDEALECCRRALDLDSGSARAQSNLGTILRARGDAEDAVAAFERALDLAPDLAPAHSNLGQVLSELGRLEDAVAALRRALELDPDLAEAHNNMGRALLGLWDYAGAHAAFRRARELRPDAAALHSDHLFYMQADAGIGIEEIYGESLRWGEAHGAALAARELAHGNARDGERRLRVGYVSPDLRDHAVGNFALPVIEAHDGARVEVVCYAEVAYPDAMTARFREASAGWRETVGLSDREVAELVREDGIDVLVDLAGHTAKNRLLVFAERPAPVQVSWLGWGGTTGLGAMDWRLTDGVADPEGAEDYHTERLMRLEGGYFCYVAPEGTPEVAERDAREGVTFGSFNGLWKVGPEVVAAWARVLEGVPGSRLIVKDRVLGEAAARERWRARFAAAGVEEGRLELRGHAATRAEHLGQYGEVDIALDTFPYNGATTTCEALYMGVPVVTVMGDRHVGRMSASILSRVDLMDLAAATGEEFVERAVALARDRERLARLHRELRPRLLASPLGDPRRLANEIETAYRNMWKEWCRSAP